MQARTKETNSVQPRTTANYARAKQAAEHFKIARSTLWLWAKEIPEFPQPIKAGRRVTLFDLDAIDAFIKSGKQL
jgi:predicted DNA-binding transcriptional regulator AlpA